MFGEGKQAQRQSIDTERIPCQDTSLHSYTQGLLG